MTKYAMTMARMCLWILILAGCAHVQRPALPASVPPRIHNVTVPSDTVGRYEKFELSVDFSATYTNPFDSRTVRLQATFTAPSGIQWEIPGFWDGRDAWRVRFSPPETGPWQYVVFVQDQAGGASSAPGWFQVIPSDHHGWLQVGAWIDPRYSPRYLVHHDGTPFYGVGHANATDLLSYGFDREKGFKLFDTMRAHGENILLYWPFYVSAFYSRSYDDYGHGEMAVIDLIVEDAARKGLYLIFTVWDHPALRDTTHPWGQGNWYRNGFRHLTNSLAFFTDPEAWIWQENLYRYIIARWGYSQAIGLWQTVSEIDGTDAYGEADIWHMKVNDFFVQNDPYRHPTTASMAGDKDWPAGFEVMDVLQMHSYSTARDPIATAQHLALWTQHMWEAAEKPNFIGEFGASSLALQPDHLHNGIWAGLASGAAITPLDWNSRGAVWGRMTPAMYQHMQYLSTFVSDVPFGHIALAPVTILPAASDLRAWAMGNATFILAWVQDITPSEMRRGDKIVFHDVPAGSYQIRPYNTWTGVYLVTQTATAEKGRLTVELPAFAKDIALKISAAPAHEQTSNP